MEATPDHEPVRLTFGLDRGRPADRHEPVHDQASAGPPVTSPTPPRTRTVRGDSARPICSPPASNSAPADAARRRDNEDQGDDEAAELLDRISDLERLLTIERVRREAAVQVAAEREKRAETAEWALLMLEARPSPVPSHQPEAVRPGAAESAGPSAGRFRAWIGIPSPPGSGAGCSAPSAAGRRSSRGPGCGRHLAWTCCLWLPSCHPTLGGAWGSRRTWSSSLRRS